MQWPNASDEIQTSPHSLVIMLEDKKPFYGKRVYEQIILS